MGYGDPHMANYYLDRNGNFRLSLWSKEPRTPRKHRGVCGAKTRKNTLCQAPPVWNKAKDKARNGRCKLHGGLSTGPKTKEGKDAIRASNQKRSKSNAKSHV